MKSKLKVIETVIERYSVSKVGSFIDGMRVGWNAYNFIFYITSIAAILGILTGWLGILYVVIIMLFFYYAGKFTERVELAKRRNRLKVKRKGEGRTKGDSR